MRVLLFCDDHYHPGDVPTKGVEPLKNKGYTIDIISDTTTYNPATIFEYDVVIMSKCDHVTKESQNSWKAPEVQKAFVDFVEKGGGLIVAHNGTVAGPDTGVLDRLAGCRFASHPNNSPITVGPLKPHPITNDVNIFCELDEHYHLEILADDIDIVAASYGLAQGDSAKYETEAYFNYPEHIAPSALVRTQGTGRVCVLTPGHHVEVWLNPEFQKMLENAINWCAKKI